MLSLALTASATHKRATVLCFSFLWVYPEIHASIHVSSWRLMQRSSCPSYLFLLWCLRRSYILRISLTTETNSGIVQIPQKAHRTSLYFHLDLCHNRKDYQKPCHFFSSLLIWRISKGYAITTPKVCMMESVLFSLECRFLLCS